VGRCDPNDPGRPKNKSSHKWTELAPLCRACRTDSIHILVLKNGNRLQKLLRSEDQVKQAKKVKVNDDFNNTS
jgi:hypothetical protein